MLHTHMPYATALTLLENGRLEMVEQNALRFHDDIAYDDTYNGLVVDNAEGDRLARVLGTKRVMFLANHGVIVVGPSVAEAFDSLYYLERACRLQVLARATGLPFRKVRPEVVRETYRMIAADTPEVRRRALRGAQAHPRPRGTRLLPLARATGSGCRWRACRTFSPVVPCRCASDVSAGLPPTPSGSTMSIGARPHSRDVDRGNGDEVGRVGDPGHVEAAPAGRAGRACRRRRRA